MMDLKCQETTEKSRTVILLFGLLF